MTPPRTLLLTLFAPDAKYTILRRYAEVFPPERLCWCSLQKCATPASTRFRHRAFVPRRLHWRLQRTWLGHVYAHECQSRRLADEIARWVADFRPEVLWVLPQLGAASVGRHLHGRLGVPLHATCHDAHETARGIVPRLYYPFYAASVNQLFRQAESVDAISEGLLGHLCDLYPSVTDANGIVFHPSIRAELVQSPLKRDARWRKGRTRRIGLCGSMRVSRRQWRSFLGELSGLPFEFELVTLAYRDRFFDVGLPANVRQRALPFAATETDVMNAFHAECVDACYLGLWRDEKRALFGQTSLSAKLVTYAAAALPIIVDARPDSLAWRLVSKHGAGVLLGATAVSETLGRLFGDDFMWNAMASGAQTLCMEEFDLATNMERFARRLAMTAGRR